MSSRIIRWSVGVLLLLGNACREGEPGLACPEKPAVVMDSAVCGEQSLDVEYDPVARKSVFFVAGPDDLAALAGVTLLNGNLQIAHTTLTTLAGLESLRCVSEGLAIADNNALTDLAGLSGLTRVGGEFLLGDLTLGGNAELQDISALANLVQIGGRLQIEQNPKLEDLNPLGALELLGDQLQIFDNAGLKSISGLAKLHSIGESFNVVQNPSLPTCEIHLFLDQLSPNRCRLVCIQKNGKDSCEDDTAECWYPWEP